MKILIRTLSVSQRTIERDLSAMKEMGVLKREGKDNDGVWIIVRNIVNWYYELLIQIIILLALWGVADEEEQCVLWLVQVQAYI